MKRIVVCSFSLLALVCSQSLPAQKLDLKIGAWEMTSKSNVLAKPMVYKDCLTKSDLEQLAGGPDQDDEECKYIKPPVISGSTWSGDKTCGPGHKVHMEFTAESAEKVHGTIVSHSAQVAKDITFEVSGHWVGASCEGIE